MIKQGTNPLPIICTVFMDQLATTQICATHHQSGYPDIQHTSYFVQRVCLLTMKSVIKLAIQICKECQTVNSAPVHWQRERLEVVSNWWQLGMDIIHYNGAHFLTFTDCNLTHFTIWHQLSYKSYRQYSVNAVHQSRY